MCMWLNMLRFHARIYVAALGNEQPLYTNMQGLRQGPREGQCWDSAMYSHSLCMFANREDILEAVERLKKEFGGAK